MVNLSFSDGGVASVSIVYTPVFFVVSILCRFLYLKPDRMICVSVYWAHSNSARSHFSFSLGGSEISV